MGPSDKLWHCAKESGRDELQDEKRERCTQIGNRSFPFEIQAGTSWLPAASPVLA